MSRSKANFKKYMLLVAISRKLYSCSSLRHLFLLILLNFWHICFTIQENQTKMPPWSPISTVSYNDLHVCVCVHRFLYKSMFYVCVCRQSCVCWQSVVLILFHGINIFYLNKRLLFLGKIWFWILFLINVHFVSIFTFLMFSAISTKRSGGYIF